MAEWRTIAERNGVHYDAYQQRIRKLGWSEEKAATTPLRKKRPVRGSISQRCRDAGIDPRLYFATRHNLGLHELSVEAIIEIVKERQA